MKWLTGLCYSYRERELVKIRRMEDELQNIEGEIARLQFLEVLDDLKEELQRREDSRNKEIRQITEELRSLGLTESEIESMTTMD